MSIFKKANEQIKKIVKEEVDAGCRRCGMPIDEHLLGEDYSYPGSPSFDDPYALHCPRGAS